ncbi:MAG: Gfo/Idh/MocA family oxidoreductase [Dysgonamonadaceae bacterium]|nr:Gfo/Idh/MocA family oxidoreductase [Dysgonamonadaceae bacterium]MDD3900580.1 Gfo/Idh/MocA family oxidoreductase [Dysgonamonadaceae bacterium]MEA5080486.1 Gfo/Idh/MocA family oxidoreductase [Dysgonamonadaceae bacterium]
MNMSTFRVNKETPILIIGAGSIGERHIRNLWQLGQRNLIVLRQRKLPLRNIGDAQIKVVTTWEEVDKYSPKVAFVCTITKLHLKEVVNCVNRDIHTFVEKPLSHTTEGLSALERSLSEHPVYLNVGYMMRFHPYIQRIREYISDKTFGNVITIQSKWAEYLPDWHPWEDYRTGYAALKELGGGVGLTLSHDIDQIFYLMDSMPNQYFVMPNYKSTLEVNVEAGMDILMKFADGTTANLHLNYFERVKERFLKVVFDEATVEFQFFDSTLTIRKSGSEDVIEQLDHFDRNDLFIDEARYFLEHLSNYKMEEVSNQIETSRKIIEICNNE